MNLATIRDRARALQMTGIGKLRKPELIRALQIREGNQACFGADWRFSCMQYDCCWREDCLVPDRPN